MDPGLRRDDANYKLKRDDADFWLKRDGGAFNIKKMPFSPASILYEMNFNTLFAFAFAFDFDFDFANIFPLQANFSYR